jgi:MTH538 TIR-like domain (DUF1863)
MSRRAFFSFHYQHDIFRVNVVRNSAMTHNVDVNDSFFDASLWERAKLSNEDSVKQLIRSGMAGCSVVCVLAGAQTWQRRWVRYEIARAVAEGKGLVTVHISSIVDVKTGYGTHRGQNPLGYMAVANAPNGGCYLMEAIDGRWLWYKDYTTAVKRPEYLQHFPASSIAPLSAGTREYDYTAQNGYRNLGGWIEDAAMAVGR